MGELVFKNDYIDELNNQHDKFTNSDISEINKTKDELSYLESLIKRFYTQKGEAENIRNIYRFIESNMDENEKTVNCYDIYTLSNVYNEYIDGMIKFIDEIININNIDVCKDSYMDKFKRAQCNDKKFIDTLFGDNQENQVFDNTKLGKSEERLSSAVSNIEFLIDIIPRLSTVKQKCDIYNKKYLDETNPIKKDLLKCSINMLYSSIRYFYYIAIKEILITYINIKDTINGKPLVQNDMYILL